MESWKLIIIGAGPAGLAAGIYGVRSGLKTLIIEEKMAGGKAADAPIIENYPGFQSIKGIELMQRMMAHCRSAGATIHEFESVIGLDLKAEKKIVKTSRASYEANAVVIASGSHYRELGVAGEKEFRGRGVSYCAICDGPLFSGKRVLVVGGGNSAVATALYLAGMATEVKIAHRREEFRAAEASVNDLRSKKNVEIMLNTEIKEIKGEKTVNKIILFNNKTEETREIPIDGVFIQVGEAPNSQLAKEAGVEVNDEGYIKVDALQRTNIPGVYAAGDVTDHPVKQIGTAVGQGIIAALEAYSFIKRPYYKR